MRSRDMRRNLLREKFPRITQGLPQPPGKQRSKNHHQKWNNKIDRRKPLREGTPQEDRFIYNNIRFNTKQKNGHAKNALKPMGQNP